MNGATAGALRRAGLLAGGMAMAFIAGVRGANAVQEPSHPALFTGAEWKMYGSREKQAYLSGFITGAAAEQVSAAATTAGTVADSAAISGAAIAKLYAGKKLHFPYAASVYSVQLDDFYWWTNHTGTPIVDVMISTNRRMLSP